MSRFIGLTGCLALFFLTGLGNGIKAQTPTVVEEVSRLLQKEREVKTAEDFLQRQLKDVRINWSPGDLVIPLTREPGNSILGATLNPIEESVRAHLNIPKGQGLVVSTLSEGGACATVGLLPYDILLTLADKPIGQVDDLNKGLKALGEKAGTLKILRAGKPVDIQVKPVNLVTLGIPVKEPSDYYIGVSIEGIDEVLQKALQLPEGKGVSITEVIADSPAEKAGFKKFDLITAIEDKPIDNPEHLRSLVQSAKNQPLKINVIRGGKPQAISVTPVLRKQEVGKNEEGQRDNYRFIFQGGDNMAKALDKAGVVWDFPSNAAVNPAITERKFAAIVAAREAAREKAILDDMLKKSKDQTDKLVSEIIALKATVEELKEKLKQKK